MSQYKKNPRELEEKRGEYVLGKISTAEMSWARGQCPEMLRYLEFFSLTNRSRVHFIRITINF